MRPGPILPAPGLALAACVALLLSLAGPAAAFDPSLGRPVDEQLYQPTEKLVAALLVDQGIRSKVDDDGDLEVTFKVNGVTVPGWLIFDRLDDGSIWNLRFTANLPTDHERRDQYREYANGWNRDEVMVKLFVSDEEELVAEQNFPVQYGLNPKEFTENGYQVFIDGVGRVLEDMGAGAVTAGEDAPADPGDNLGEPIVASDAPARSIGLLEMADGTVCSASVVAPDVILTAAHCLFDDDHNRVSPALFSAGYDRGDTVATSKIRDVYLPPEYDHEKFLTTNDIDGYDYAFLRLNRDIGDDTGILPVRVLNGSDLDAMVEVGGTSFTQIGYGNEESDHPVVRRNCHIEQWWDDNTYAHHCGTVPGDSGSPNLILRNGEYAIVGIESAEVDFRNLKGADMVVAASAFADALAEFSAR